MFPSEDLRDADFWGVESEGFAALGEAMAAF